VTKPICFVAMRIGDKETDLLYRRVMKPTIRRVGLVPRRIDHIMHNGRIDQRIQKELTSCHVMVGDLTFARPSVYWEAGFGEGRGIPVIYTCRTDHFRARPHDDLGNFKVHFDLHTQKILPWNSKHDKKFAANLEKQLRFVLRPLQQERARNQEFKREEEAFLSLSTIDQINALWQLTLPLVKKASFVIRESEFDVESFGATAGKKVLNPTYNQSPFLVRDSLKSVLTGRVLIVTKFGSRDLKELNQACYYPMDRKRAKKAFQNGKVVSDHHILISFTPVSSKLIGERLRDFRRITGDGCSSWFTSRASPISDKPTRPHECWLHVIDTVRSVRQAGDRIAQLLRKFKRVSVQQHPSSS